MRKNNLIFGFVSLSLLLFACGGTSSGSESSNGSHVSSSEASSSSETSSSSIAREEFYLTGNVDLNGPTTMKLDRSGTIYTCHDIVLKRGNSFLIYSDGERRVGYDDLTVKNGFNPGQNSYIEVENEGVYDLSLDMTAAPSLTLTKKDSAYKTVKLVFQSGHDSIEFTKNEDFTFSLTGVDLRYREKFYVELDDEILTYDAVSYNETYCSALRFDSTSIEAIQKGSFDFTVDFAHKQPLSISSDTLETPNILPVDGDTYERLIDSLDKQFNANGTRLTATETVMTDSSTVMTEYLETIDLNQHYNESYNDSTELRTKRARLFNEHNYYELTAYENSESAKPSVSGKKIGTAPEKNPEEEESSVVTVDKEYITEDEAKNSVQNFTGFDSTLRGYLNNVIHISHLSGVSDSAHQQYKQAAVLQSSYLGTVGDAMKVKAYNEEKDFPLYGTKKLVQNSIELEIDNRGFLTEGTIEVVSFEGNDKFDENKEVKPDATATKKTTYTFTYEYGTRRMLTTFTLDPSVYITESFLCLPSIDVECGATLSTDNQLKPLSYSPMTAIDLSNMTIIRYDSDYINKGYNSFTAKNAGTTTVLIGNTYNDVSVEVEINISYKKTSRISINSADNSYFVGSIYTFTATVNSYEDPVVSVSLDEEYMRLVSIDSEETMEKNQKATFQIEMLKPTSSATITISSKHYASVSSSKSISIIEPFTTESVAGTYRYYSYAETYFTLNSDGSGELKDNSGNIHQFSYEIQNGNVLSLVSSDTLSSISATIASVDPVIKGIKLNSLTVKNTSGSTLSGMSYSTYFRELPLFSHSYVTSDGKTLNFSNPSFTSDGQKAHLSIMNGAVEEVKCDWTPLASSSYSKYSSIYVDGNYVSSSSFELIVSDYSEQSFTLTVKKSGAVYATYNFTLSE